MPPVLEGIFESPKTMPYAYKARGIRAEAMMERELTMSEKRDLFISYHTDSSKWMVEKIVAVLEGRGISCWYAPRDCEDVWADEILKAIDKASMFLVIINEHSMNSEHVKNEINAAFSRYSKSQIAIIVFKADTAQMNSTTEYYLGRIHMVNGVVPPIDDRIGELANRIAYTKEHLDSKAELSLNSSFKSAIITPALCFIGRENELAELDEGLTTYCKVFVTGMGGVGKSELVRAYLVQQKKRFRSIMHATYTTSLKDIIINDNLVGISNFFRNPPDESDDSYFARKMRFIEEHGTPEDLLVIDNFNAAEDEHLAALMQLPISIIFTTRNTYEDYFNLKLDVIRDSDKLLEIFKKHYPKELGAEDTQCVKRIFALVGNHTLAITIIATMMKKQRISPKAMIEKLEMQVQYQIQTQKDVNDMITSVFEMSDITEDERAILQNMTLVPAFGISTETFYEYCGLDTYEVIDGLIAKNLISHDFARDYIALHPVIDRTVRKKIGYSDQACERFIGSVTEILNQAKYIDHTRREWILEMVDQMMRVLPETSAYYETFYLAASKAFHAFAKHNLTVEKIERLNREGVSLYTRVEAMTDVADAYRCMEMADQLLEKANQALELCKLLDPEKPRSKKLISELHGRFGWYYHMTKDYEKSFAHFRKQLDLVLTTEGETEERIGWAYFNVGLVKNDSGEYTQAIEYFEQSLAYFQKIDMEYAIASTYRTLGKSYYALGDYEMAIKRVLSALELFTKLNGEMHNDTACTKYVLAQIYRSHGECEKAAQLFGEAVACVETLGYAEMSKVWTREWQSET